MKINKNKKLILFLLFFVYCAFGGSILDNEIIIDIPSCDISTRNQEINKKDILNEIYVVGHAYGKPGEGDFFPNNLTSFFDRNLTNNLSYIALTGDFVREPTEESYEKVKLYIEKEFQDYFIAMGNHEIKNSGLTNYYKFFNNNLFFKEFDSFLLISANFSNPDWLPNKEQKETINRLINETSKEYIILLSHQIFWLAEVNKSTPAKFKIEPNSDDLLNTVLNNDSLGWIENKKDKYFIVVSGDYGAWGDKTYCKAIENKLFIANGIGNNESDTIIKIIDFKDSFKLIEMPLN